MRTFLRLLVVASVMLVSGSNREVLLKKDISLTQNIIEASAAAERKAEHSKVIDEFLEKNGWFPADTSSAQERHSAAELAVIKKIVAEYELHPNQDDLVVIQCFADQLANQYAMKTYIFAGNEFLGHRYALIEDRTQKDYENYVLGQFEGQQHNFAFLAKEEKISISDWAYKNYEISYQTGFSDNGPKTLDRPFLSFNIRHIIQLAEERHEFAKELAEKCLAREKLRRENGNKVLMEEALAHGSPLL